MHDIILYLCTRIHEDASTSANPEKHIAEHGSIFTPDVVYGVLEKFRSCLLEMLLNSKRVKIALDLTGE